ncbi:hypothetical protein RAS1_12690 [Phycisphaerae bacterium RAS1]|nr:hypothetical protein RAS1_12690 [Phycisphaerae bacterium RAS1]
MSSTSTPSSPCSPAAEKPARQVAGSRDPPTGLRSALPNRRGRRMATQVCFFASNRHDQRTIEAQGADRGAAHRRQAGDEHAVPTEVLAPRVVARIEQLAGSPDAESTAVCLAPFRSEHDTQASARLSDSSVPAAREGTMWSMWKVASCPAWESPQYSQRLPARSTTCRRISAGTERISSRGLFCQSSRCAGAAAKGTPPG